MEGFIHLKMPLWARRVLTRLLAIASHYLCHYLWR